MSRLPSTDHLTAAQKLGLADALMRAVRTRSVFAQMVASGEARRLREEARLQSSAEPADAKGTLGHIQSAKEAN